MSTEEDIIIRLLIEQYGADAVQNKFIMLGESVKGLETTIRSNTDTLKELRANVREATGVTEYMISPVRRLSWDFMLTGRALSVLNTTFLGSNQIVKQFIGVIYGAAAILRLYVTVNDILIASKKMAVITETLHGTALAHGNAQLVARTGLLPSLISMEWAHVAVLKAKAAILAAIAFLGPAGLGIALGGAAIGLGYIIGQALIPAPSPPIEEKMGLYATRSPTKFLTGPLAGITVPELTPGASTTYHSESRPSYSQINIDLRTGPISSQIDIEDIADTIAVRIVDEQRRRSG